MKKLSNFKLLFLSFFAMLAFAVLIASCGKDDDNANGGTGNNEPLPKNLTQAEYASAVTKAQSYMSSNKATVNGTIVSTFQGISHTESLVANIDSASKKWAQYTYNVENGKSTLNGFVYQDDKTAYIYQKMYTSQTEFTEGKYILTNQQHPNFNFNLNLDDLKIDNSKTTWKVDGSVLTGTFSDTMESTSFTGKIEITFDENLYITSVKESVTMTATQQGTTFTGNIAGNYSVTYGSAETSFPSGFNKADFTQAPPMPPLPTSQAKLKTFGLLR
jgi:hypothetical protein